MARFRVVTLLGFQTSILEMIKVAMSQHRLKRPTNCSLHVDKIKKKYYILPDLYKNVHNEKIIFIQGDIYYVHIFTIYFSSSSSLCWRDSIFHPVTSLSLEIAAHTVSRLVPWLSPTRTGHYPQSTDSHSEVHCLRQKIWHRLNAFLLYAPHDDTAVNYHFTSRYLYFWQSQKGINNYCCSILKQDIEC